MKYFIVSCLLSGLISCTDEYSPYKSKSVDLSILQKAERIIPTDEEYILLEVQAYPKIEESGRQLLLYDKQGNFIDGVRLFGIVQSTSKNKISINRTYNVFEIPSSIGFLNINYTELTRKSRGGVDTGSHLVDSLKYNPNNKFVTIYAKKPVKQFVILPRELKFNEALFTQSEIFRIPLWYIRFNPFYDNRFTITSWESKNETNYTMDFYFDDKIVLDNLFQQIIASEFSDK